MIPILFIGGMYDNEHLHEVVSYSKKHADFAANLFQQRILNGFDKLDIPVERISAPFIAQYPFSSTKVFFNGFRNDSGRIKYIKFCNIFGIRNYSRERAIYSYLKKYCSENEDEKLIVIYSPHTPFIKAAARAKKKYHNIRICMIVPDLPQYMNLSNKVPLYYRVAKKIDIRIFNKYQQYADSFVILTKQMSDVLNIGMRRYCVTEGIADEAMIANKVQNRNSRTITIAYTGTLNESFGVLNLVRAFMSINQKNLRLVICGGGEVANQIKAFSQIDPRIDFRGIVHPNEACKIIREANILVNPRSNNSEYTKYSFPSKLIEYLQTGNPVICYQLPGIPDYYSEFLHFIPQNGVDAMAKTIENVINMPNELLANKSREAIKYLKNNLTDIQFVKRLISLNYDV